MQGAAEFDEAVLRRTPVGNDETYALELELRARDAVKAFQILAHFVEGVGDRLADIELPHAIEDGHADIEDAGRDNPFGVKNIVGEPSQTVELQ